MNQRIVCAVLSLTIVVLTAQGQSNLTAKVNGVGETNVSPALETDRVRDGLAGPVRRVRTEVVKLSTSSGKTEEGKRVLLETAEYDVNGTKIQNQYFPIAGASLTGHEVYKYDDKGNISEMTLLNADGSVLSKESYKYEFDSAGNWIRMTSSLAVVENGKIEFDPTEVTYRSIFYYLDASTAKMLASPDTSSPANINQSKVANADSPVDRVTVPPLVRRASVEVLKGNSITPPITSTGALLNESKSLVTMNDNEVPPAPRPLLKPVSGGVLNGKALELPAPHYPDTARQMHTFGKVEVEVIVDEKGKVISARALSGPPMLRDAAVEAANRARFSPSKLSGQPVKVSGRIEYNFRLF